MSKKRIIIWLIIGIIFLFGISLMLYVFVPRKLKTNLALPNGFEFKISNFDNYILIESDKLSIHFSEDRSPYEDTFWYIDYYQNRFYTNEDYLKENNMTLRENRTIELNGNKTLILSLTKHYENLDDTTYTYVFIQTDGQNYTRFMFKTILDFNDEYIETYEKVINSYSTSKKDTFRTTAIYYSNKVIKKLFHKNDFFKAYKTEKLDLKPIANKNWDEKTKELYNKFLISNEITWGIFTVNDVKKAMDEKIPDIEEKLDYKFDIVLVYNHLGNPLQIEEMKKIHEENRIIELTVQTCVNNNTKLFGYTPIFDILDGKKDDQIRTLAREVKEFGNPVLFRLNNEMNTDWTSYSGIIALSDATIYKDVWKYIYKIFEEENVTNCIWIFNPNDNNYPPSIWNNFLCYYPGNEYVQMLGITGYNTGTYYEKQNAERFREFKEIYDDINGKYKDIFNEFPWIITEFASSSIGGDKAKWIEGMFENIKNYPNIKAAIWFSNADYDPAYEGNTQVSRPYWLDETPETVEAFKKGIHNSK